MNKERLIEYLDTVSHKTALFHQSHIKGDDKKVVYSESVYEIINAIIEGVGRVEAITLKMSEALGRKYSPVTRSDIYSCDCIVYSVEEDLIEFSNADCFHLYYLSSLCDDSVGPFINKLINTLIDQCNNDANKVLELLGKLYEIGEKLISLKDILLGDINA